MSEQDAFCIEGSVQAGTFRVEAAVAEGGFAVVYRAYHITFRAPVALKCLKVPTSLSAAHQAEFLEQFRGEAELLFRLSARIPAVVRPLHAGTLEGASVSFVPYLAMEWLDGATLEDLLAGRLASGAGPLPLEELVPLLEPVAEGLHQAHFFPTAEGTVTVLHRDLKPANIFVAVVDGRRTAKILDFGIAKVKSAATAVVGKESMHAGTLPAFTPGYAAPEQWAPKRFGQTGPWTDVWGLALTMVEAITGRAPIDGDHAAMLGAALDPELRPTPHAVGMSVPDPVEAVFRKAVAVHPKDRYLSVADYYADLRRAVGGAPAERVQPAAASRSPAALPFAHAQQPPNSARDSPSRAPPTPEVPDLTVAPIRSGAPARRGPAPRSPLPRAERGGQRAIDDDLDFGGIVRVSDPDPRAEPSRGQAAGGPAREGQTAAPCPGRTRQRKPGHITIDREAALPAPGGGPSLQSVQRERLRRELDPLATKALADQDRKRSEREAIGSLREKLTLPSELIVAAIVIAGLGVVYETVSGGPIPLPFRPMWIAGPLVVFGVALGIYRLVFSDDD
ncbi:MAG: protein kinase [Polyangiaceae bacterium]|nr:protein kinase [Polyangiaceae bacterium]